MTLVNDPQHATYKETYESSRLIDGILVEIQQITERIFTAVMISPKASFSDNKLNITPKCSMLYYIFNCKQV